jgi:hypothetical protein
MADYDAQFDVPVEAPDEDLIEQHTVLDPDAAVDLITATELPVEADEADVVEQAITVEGDEDYPPA